MYNNFFINSTYRAVSRFISLNIQLKIWGRQNQTVAGVFENVVKSHPNKIAFVMDDAKFTFQQVRFNYLKN